MLNRIRDLLLKTGPGPAVPDPGQRLKLAAAALMVRAASLDGEFGDAERDTIRRLLRERFTLSVDDTAALIAEADAMQEDSTQILPFTRALKDALDEAERVRIVEMLWDVVLADGVLHDYEANLMRRIAGLLYVSDQESGAARQRAQARTVRSG